MRGFTRMVFWLGLAFWGAQAAEDPLQLSFKARRDARKIYVAKCAKCHRFYEPMEYGAEAWKRWMASMSEKSKLKQGQAELLNQYLDAYRARRLTGKPQDKVTKPRDSDK